MAILEIKKAGDPVLKQVAAPIERLTKRHRQILDDMAETRWACRAAGGEVSEDGGDRRTG